MALMIANIFIDQIEKEFKDHLPPRCVKMLMLMAEQQQALEKAIEVVHNQNLKTMKFITLTDTYQKLLKQTRTEEDIIQRMQREFDEATATDHVGSEKIKKGDIENA